jgi:hypothetical protein
MDAIRLPPLQQPLWLEPSQQQPLKGLQQPSQQQPLKGLQQLSQQQPLRGLQQPS